MIASLIFLFVLFLIAFYYLKKKWSEQNLPPEAPGKVLLLGHLPHLGRDDHETFDAWSKEVGPIFRVISGPILTMYVVTGYELMKDILQKRGDVFADRPDNPFTIALTKIFQLPDINYGIINSSGNVWKEQRRFSLQILRDFGFGKKQMQEKVEFETEKLIDRFENAIDGNQMPLDIDPLVKACVCSVIANVVLGVSYEPDDAEFQSLVKNVTDIFHIGGSAEFGIAVSFPILQKIEYFKNRLRYGELERCGAELVQYWTKHVKQHQMNLKTKETADDFVDAYLAEIERRRSNGEDMGTLDVDQLITVIGDIWLAGFETSATTLQWAVLYMIHNPEIQDKLFRELKIVFGESAMPSWDHRTKTPLMLAAIDEVQRLGIATSTGFHTNLTEDTTVGDFKIPKGSVILPVIYCVHRNPEFFPNPSEFNLDRFINDETGGYQKSEYLIPFGMGKRICMGEGLARMELYIIFSRLIQRFQFLPVDPENLPTLKGDTGFTLIPKPFKCIIKHRN